MSPLLAVLACLAAAIVMFAINRPRLDAVGLIMLVALPFTGVMTMNEALAGFSDPNIVLIAALFVIGDGLVRTGVAQRVGDWLLATAGRSEIRLIVLLMLAVCGLGAIMSSTAVTAIFIPVALRIAAERRHGPGRLMMPLSVAALISGMPTLVGDAAQPGRQRRTRTRGRRWLRLLQLHARSGSRSSSLGVVYMLFARRWLSAKTPSRRPAARASPTGSISTGSPDREYRLRVPDRSPLVGTTLAELKLPATSGANIVAIERNRRFAREMLQPAASTEVMAGDILLVDLSTPTARSRRCVEKFALEEMPLSGAYFTDRSQEIGMAEVILPPTSSLIGQTLVTAEFRARFRLTAVGMRRGLAAQAVDLPNDR